MSDLDLDLWKLPPGDYKIAIGLFTRDEDGKGLTVSRSEAGFEICSKAEATYYFGQMTDLKRRVRKLEKSAGRLFK
jgi:hypothetical protein